MPFARRVCSHSFAISYPENNTDRISSSYVIARAPNGINITPVFDPWLPRRHHEDVRCRTNLKKIGGQCDVYTLQLMLLPLIPGTYSSGIEHSSYEKSHQ